MAYPDLALVRCAFYGLVALCLRRGGDSAPSRLQAMLRYLLAAAPVLELLKLFPVTTAVSQALLVGVMAAKDKLGQRRPHPVDAENVFTTRVWPGDMDLYGHMNNVVYNARMEWGRHLFDAECGLLTYFHKNRIAVGLYTTTVKFRRELRLLQGFRVRTRLLGWNERTFYFEHLFETEAQGRTALHAQGISLLRIARRSPRTCIDVLLAMEASGLHRPCATPLDRVADAVRLPQALHDFDTWFSERAKVCEEADPAKL
eukprot:TRINITY_DN17605_c0_g1_i1.p1 TRINITY_DN17605_c0_g1~~TRINITY_DN17605_c0_g1_i1.p1  ORF type:complete len:258 (+),score=51.89 TRINITY_DN17605_c0_g1_i1:60-833(+)